MTPNNTASAPPPHRWFVTTHWTAVLDAGRNDTTRAHDALATLCQSYWYPLYAYVRHRGYSPHDAQDLTQTFFARLLEKNTLSKITRDKGKFRSFLLTVLDNFLRDEWRRAKAEKRGALNAISLDAGSAETRFQDEPIDSTSAETIFERNWALALLEQAFQQVEREYQEEGKADLFAKLKFCLTGERSAIAYDSLAARLKTSEGNIKVMVHRLRHRYREVLRAEVAHTVSDPSEIETELRHLFNALSR